jgi:ubiquitin-activating enzyme E1
VDGRREDGSEMTLKEFIDYFQEKNLSISMISYDVSILYAFFLQKSKLAERLKTPVSSVTEVVTKKSLPSHIKYLVLEICCSNANDEDVDVPFINYRFR